jgi:hypothetical protein
MSVFLRRSIGTAASALPVCMSFAAADYAFDTKGFNTTTNGLQLGGVGMRRKNFYIVEVDVYQTALNLSESALTASQTCMKQGADKCVLADDLFKSIKAASKPNAEATVTLRFVRNVTKAQVVDAFNEAFAGLDVNEIAGFKSELARNVGDDGCKVGEEIVFNWIGGGGLAITRGGEQAGGSCYRSEGIEKRLLEVYVDKKRTVSPELVKCIEENILKV